MSKYVQLCYVSRDTSPDDWRSISRNVASLNIFVHDVRNFLYYEHRTDKGKYFNEFMKLLVYYTFSFSFDKNIIFAGTCCHFI